MQRSSVQEPPRYVQVPREDYPYLLSYLEDRFGEAERSGNVFWATNGAPKQVAVLLESGDVLFQGKSLLDPEKTSLASLVAQQKKKGRRITVSKALGLCYECDAFFMQDARDGVPEVHETNDGFHALRNVGVYGYRKYVPWRKPLYQSKGWIKPQLLYDELAKSMDPQTAHRLVDLRLTAFREGTRVTPEELVKHASNPEALFDSVVFERALAYKDAMDAQLVPKAPTQKRAVSLGLPTTTHTTPKRTQEGVIHGGQDFLCWTIKYNGKELTADQKKAVALQFGVPLSDALRAGIPTRVALALETRDNSKALTQAVDDAVKDSVLLGAEEEPEAAGREQKEHWQVRRRHARTKSTWKDRRPSEVGSIRYDKPITTVAAPCTQQDPPDEKEQSPEDARKSFFEKFNLTQADVVYEREDGLVKAAKSIFTAVGTGRIEFFNVPLMPQRIPYESEWDPDATKVAHELAKELDGRVVVCEQRKKGWKSLAVAVGGYTVRVATKRFSLP